MASPTATATEIEAEAWSVTTVEARSVATVIIRIRIAVVAVMRLVIIAVVATYVSRAMPMPTVPVTSSMNQCGACLFTGGSAWAVRDNAQRGGLYRHRTQTSHERPSERKPNPQSHKCLHRT